MKKKKTVKGNQSRPEVINFVCKYDLKFNHARVYDDRKRKMKAGYCKHKNGIMPGDGDFSGFFYACIILESQFSGNAVCQIS